MNWYRTTLSLLWGTTISCVAFIAWLYYLPIDVDPGD